MLQVLVGNVDAASAAVLVIACICACIGFAVVLLRPDKAQDFELAKAKLQNERETNAFYAETKRLSELAKVEKGLITSHRETD